MKFDTKLKFARLFDFYKNLLSKKQIEVGEYVYNLDESLGEIAEKFNVSRQAISCSLKSLNDALMKYEDKLKMCEKFDKMSEYLDNSKVLEEVKNKIYDIWEDRT